VDIKKIRAEYIASDLSVNELAKKHGVSPSTIRNYSTKEKWKELRAKAGEKAVKKIVEHESDKQADRMKRLLVVSDKLLQAVEDAVDKFVAEELVFEKGVLKSLSGAIKDIKEIQNIKSQLDIEEQKARIAILKKQAEADTDKDASVTIFIEGGDDEWQD
jgi:uncharacterized protein YjcR